jgi:opacity protein-like surface antigen
MNKKLLVATLFAASTTGAFAQSAFEGFYGQAGIGYESTSVSFSGGSVQGFPYGVSADNSNSFAGTVGIGTYFALTSNFLLGIGAEYSPIPGSNANVTLSIPGTTTPSISGTYKKKDSYNLFISPAIAIDKDKLAYAKVGYTGANIETSILGSSNTTSYTGYSLGLGYKQIIRGGLYGFGEVNYAAYSSKSDGGGFSGTNKPTATNVLVGIGYKF